MASTDLAWYSGDDALNLPLLSVGAVGVVSVVGHVLGDRLGEMIELRIGPVTCAGAARLNASMLPVVRRACSARRASSWPRPPCRCWASRPVRCACRWWTRPQPSVATLRADLAEAGVAGFSRVSPATPSCPPPPRWSHGVLRVVALGGLGEIGRNMTVFEFDGRLLIVDCGVLFPEESQPGVDLILPDFAHIRDRLDDIEAIVLTHGHEDHIGARAVPAAASARTSRSSARGSRWRWSRPSCRSTASRRTRSRSPRASASGSGPFDVRVRRGQPLDPRRDGRGHPHAAPALCCTPATSRWTSCPSTVASPTCAAFARLGDEGVDLLLVDSTNAEVPGFVTARARHRPGARLGVPPAPRGGSSWRRFASHVHRIQQVLDAAREPRAQGRLRRPLDGAQHGRRP